MATLLKKLKSLKGFLWTSIFVNVLSFILLVVFVKNGQIEIMGAFLMFTIASYIIAVINGIKAVGIQKYLPATTPGYTDAGTIKIIGIISILVGGHILDIVLLVLVNKLINEIKTNPIYNEPKQDGQFPQSHYQNPVQNEVR